MPKTPLFRLHRAALSVAEQLTLNPAVQAIAITGSVARGDTSPVSDIDLWILGNRNTRETFQHSRISVTLLWQTVDQALTDDTLLRFEVEDAFVLYDPDGLFRKVRALYWKRREELRAAMIRNTTKVIRDFISQAQQQSPEAAIALIREAGRRSAALRIYLDLGWRVPKWRHFNKYLRHQCFEKLRLLQNLTVDCSTWKTLTRYMRTHEDELQLLQESTNIYPPPLPSLKRIQYLSKHRERERALLSIRESLQGISHGQNSSPEAKELWRIVHGFDQKPARQKDVQRTEKQYANLVKALQLNAQLDTLNRDPDLTHY